MTPDGPWRRRARCRLGQPWRGLALCAPRAPQHHREHACVDRRGRPLLRVRHRRGADADEDLRRYPLGSILAGGDSGPHGDERAAPAAWLALAREFRAVSVERRAGHTPIPVLSGIDAVHGHNNVVGAVIYPHNIGLGAAHDPQLLERIGAASPVTRAQSSSTRTLAREAVRKSNDRFAAEPNNLQ